MADAFRFDTAELDALADVLADSFDRTMDAAVRVTKRGAQNIKKDAIARITAATPGPYVTSYPRSISYDIDESGTEVTAEIGPDKDRPQGALGNLLEFGSAKNAPLPHLGPAFEDEVPRYVENLGKHVGDVILP